MSVISVRKTCSSVECAENTFQCQVHRILMSVMSVRNTFQCKVRRDQRFPVGDEFGWSATVKTVASRHEACTIDSAGGIQGAW